MARIRILISDLVQDESAQAMVEYVVVTFILILACYGAIEMFRNALASSFRATASNRAGVKGVLP
jgi:hypothetical protein